MKLYGVTLPIVGSAYVEVEADSEEAAIEAAMEAVTLNDIDQWEALERIVRGNVFYGPTNSVDVRELEG